MCCEAPRVSRAEGGRGAGSEGEGWGKGRYFLFFWGTTKMTLFTHFVAPPQNVKGAIESCWEGRGGFHSDTLTLTVPSMSESHISASGLISQIWICEKRRRRSTDRAGVGRVWQGSVELKLGLTRLN